MNKITKLPDGSAFCTATIMSKEEAMALPLKKRLKLRWTCVSKSPMKSKIESVLTVGLQR